MARYQFSILIKASQHEVFALWTDLDRMPEWVGGVTAVGELTGPIDRPSTRYTVWFGRMRSSTEILEVERPRHIRTRFDSALLRGETDATFERENGATRLTQVFQTRGVISAIVARLFATGSYRGSFRGELEAFRAIAEREAKAHGPTSVPR
jgi:uncharacterized protein YndB with AHSA1/START domain